MSENMSDNMSENMQDNAEWIDKKFIRTYWKNMKSVNGVFCHTHNKYILDYEKALCSKCPGDRRKEIYYCDICDGYYPNNSYHYCKIHGNLNEVRRTPYLYYTTYCSKKDHNDYLGWFNHMTCTISCEK